MCCTFILFWLPLNALGDNASFNRHFYSVLRVTIDHHYPSIFHKLASRFPTFNLIRFFKSKFLHANPNNLRLCFSGTGTHLTPLIIWITTDIFLRNQFSALTFSVLLETSPKGRFLYWILLLVVSSQVQPYRTRMLESCKQRQLHSFHWN